MSAMNHADLPEIGQLVELRRRQWVVTDIDVSGVDSESYSAQHLVTAESIDEDATDEQIRVVWELELGARVLVRAGLPSLTGFDSYEETEAFLDAIRWGTSSNADRQFLQAPFRSGISIEDYQLDPLVRAVEMARVNLLIADDVGLGKTIEAGLVIRELLLRHRARTVFIVCPASLQVKWQTEMREKFGLEFRIVDADYLRTVRRERSIHCNPWTSYPRLITSMDWIKSGEGLRMLKDALPPQISYPRKFDILLVDEAHNIAPAAAAAYSIPSQRTQVIQRIAPHFTHHLFLSATPHNGYTSSFTSLLELLDDQRFAKNVMPSDAQLQPVMVRRMKRDIVDADGNHVFPFRRLEGLEIDYTDAERDIHQTLQEFSRLRLESAKGRKSAYGTEFVQILLKKRLFSSPAAFARTLSKHQETLLNGQTGRSSKKKERILHAAILRAEEDFESEAKAEEARDEAVVLASSTARQLTPDEERLLKKLVNWATENAMRVDSKARAILKWLDTHVKTDGQWNGKRVILFTEYLDTHTWLKTILANHGYSGENVMELHGGLDSQEREEVKAAFQTSPEKSPVRVLLATDAAAEGIDLQNYCNYMIHVEIPWNPNVLEQRNGRIDRHGQKEKEVFIWYPVGKGFDRTKLEGELPKNISGDAEYLMRTALKVDTIREELGCMGDVLERGIVSTMLDRHDGRTADYAEVRRKKAARLAKIEQRIRDRIVSLHNHLLSTRQDFHLAPDRIVNAVQVALRLAEKPSLKPASVAGVPDGMAYELPVLQGTWADAMTGLEHPHTHKRRAITFDHDIVKGREEDLVLAHLNHRLVSLSLRLLREEVWKLDDIKKLHRVSVRAIDPNLTGNKPVALVWSRLLITGGDHARLHEELVFSAGYLRGERDYKRIETQGEIVKLLEAAKPCTVSERIAHVLKRRFESTEASVMASVDRRSKDRLQHLANTIARRMESEIKDVNTVLDELTASIKKELHEPAVVQLELFTDLEKKQFDKDVAALQARLARIPEERMREIEIIKKHYSNPVDRTFPVAVLFLVPDAPQWEVQA